MESKRTYFQYERLNAPNEACDVNNNLTISLVAAGAEREEEDGPIFSQIDLVTILVQQVPLQTGQSDFTRV